MKNKLKNHESFRSGRGVALTILVAMLLFGIAAGRTLAGSRINKTGTDPKNKSGREGDIPEICKLTTSPSVTKDPKPMVSACVGGDAEFSVEVAGKEPYTYQWTQVTDKEVSVGTSSPIYKAEKVTADNNGERYYVVITDVDGCVAKSEAATLIVDAHTVQLAIPPSSIRSCEGDIDLSGKAKNPEACLPLNIKWQVSTGGAFTDIPKSNSSVAPKTFEEQEVKYSLKAVTVAAQGNQYRMVANVGAGCFYESKPITIEIVPTTAIAKAPTNTIFCKDANAAFTVEARNATAFQWQASTEASTEGTTWTDLTDEGVYTGSTSASLTLNKLPDNSLVGMHYRAIVKGACTAVTPLVSEAATLNLPPNSGDMVEDVSDGMVGQGIKFSTTITDEGTTFVWDFGDNTTGTEPDPTHIYNTAGTFTPTVTIKSPTIVWCSDKLIGHEVSITGKPVSPPPPTPTPPPTPPLPTPPLTGLEPSTKGVWPNPTDRFVYLKHSDNVAVLDMTGRMLIAPHVQTANIETIGLDLQNLTAGLYLVVTDGVYYKIIKK